MAEEIIQIAETNKEIISQRTQKEKESINHIFAITKEVVAVLFWIYVLTKLFVFDIDIFLVNKFFPEYAFLLNFKFFILIGTIAVIWLITKNKYILSWLLYIFFYPAIILFWKIPVFVFKQKSWLFAFALINALISFFKSIKYNFIIAALFLVSAAVIFSFSSEKLLWPVILIIFVILTIVYFQKFISIFRPSSIFQVHIKIFSAIRKHGIASFSLDESIKNLPVESLDPKQLEKRTANLQISVLFNRICLFAVKKLRDYQNSRLNIVSYVFTILLLIVLTIFSFAIINLGLFKINHEFFSFSTIPSFFTFFYYSFNNLLFNSIQEITPVMSISQSVSMIESFFSCSSWQFLFLYYYPLEVKSMRRN